MPVRNATAHPPITTVPAGVTAGVTAGFGLTPLHVDKSAAASLLNALQTARTEAKGPKETLRFPGRGDRGAPLCFHGWDTYSNVAAEQHDPRQQSKYTCVLYRGERGMLPRLLAVLPEFGDVLALANSAAPDMEIALVHALFQDSPQARFDWHRDNEVKDSEDVERTIVILRSGHASAGTVKVALFLKPRRPRPAEGPDTTHARGSADSMSVGPDAEHGVASVEEESGLATPVTVVAEVVEAEVAALAAEVAADGVMDTTVDGKTTGEANGDRLKRKAEMQLMRTEEKLARTRGAIIAPSRTGEGFALATGRAESCLVDAVVDGMTILDANTDVSLVKMRRLAIPELGNERQASWKTAKEAMLTMQLPFELHEATALFRSSGAPMLNLLKAEPGVYIIGLDVGVRAAGVEKKYRHCVCLTTIATEHAPLGRLMDNNARTKPVYIESTDLVHKVPAKKVWRKLLQQSVGHDNFWVNTTDVYQLRKAE
mmetsp:Transcript_34108/g.85546  ORF Transcript_34108/g.85546 Transcript_34108/m.85546 type:complete len:486 (-) Transcript_34108:190-1647(-)